MELDDTQHAAREVDAQLGDVDLGQAAPDLDARRRRAQVAASLFGEQLESVKIGRFSILNKLGVGGMGVVYVAYDEQLDRRVAVKLLHGAAHSDETRARFEREAQAMARLSHPNVVTVHEVGRHEGETFVAMEFVDGQDLRGWLDEAGGGWVAVVDVFRQAGEGLAAAHEAGIVHRDFKPDNVLMGKDGRVRVADFGLAHGLAEVLSGGAGDGEDAGSLEDESTLEESGQISQTSQLEVALTRTGALMGTPVYMAPEQLVGRRSDARGDQFSFCAALWEGLYGQRPFSGDNLMALAQATASGELDPPPTERDVPPWLRAIVVRGLAPAPDDRWPSMRALLDALADDPRARWRRLIQRVVIAAGVVALLGVAYLAASALDHNRRQRYFNDLTETLLQLERARGLAQAQDDAIQARDATRMNVVRSHRARVDLDAREDPTLAAALLREVEGRARESPAWISAANEVLGGGISEHVISDHRGAITSLSFSPDGLWLYSASDDGVVRRTRRQTGASEIIETHAKAVLALALSPDGRHLASSAEDGVVKLWSAATETSRELGQHGREVATLAWDSVSAQVASGARDGTVQVHALAAGGGSRSFTLPNAVTALAFAADDRRVLAGCNKLGELHRWAGEDQPLEVFAGHSMGIYFIEVLDGGRVLTGADDGTARLWALDGGDGDVDTGVVVTRHDEPISAIDVDLEAGRVATAALDGTIHVTAYDRPGESVELPGHADQIWSLAFVEGGSAVVTGSFDKTAHVTSIDGRRAPWVLRGHGLAIFGLAVDPSGRWLATGSYDTDVRVWDLDAWRLGLTLPGHRASVTSVEVDASGTRAVTGSVDGLAQIWDVQTGALTAALDQPGPRRRIDHAVFSPDGELVALARHDGTIDLWSLADGQSRVLEGHGDRVWRLAFDGAGERLVSASHDETARIWDVASGRTLHVLTGHANEVVAAAFDLSGDRVVSASRAGTVHVWDAASGAARATLTGHEGKIFTLVPSPDGRVWATGSDDGTVRLWPSDLAAEPLVLAGHGKDVWAVAFDESGERLASACNDGRARIWDVHDGRLLETLAGHDNVVWDLGFLPDGRLVTASSDATVRVWTPDTGRSPVILRDDAQLRVLAIAAGGIVIVGGEDARAMAWATRDLSDDSASLLERLWSATRYCLPAQMRTLELGEDPSLARQAEARCRRRVSGRG